MVQTSQFLIFLNIKKCFDCFVVGNSATSVATTGRAKPSSQTVTETKRTTKPQTTPAPGGPVASQTTKGTFPKSKLGLISYITKISMIIHSSLHANNCVDCNKPFICRSNRWNSCCNNPIEKVRTILQFSSFSSQPRHATVFSGKPQINPGVLASRHVLQLNIQIFSAGIKQEWWRQT